MCQNALDLSITFYFFIFHNQLILVTIELLAIWHFHPSIVPSNLHAMTIIINNTRKCEQRSTATKITLSEYRFDLGMTCQKQVLHLDFPALTQTL